MVSLACSLRVDQIYFTVSDQKENMLHKSMRQTEALTSAIFVFVVATFIFVVFLFKGGNKTMLYV